MSVVLTPETRVYRSIILGLAETDPAACVWIAKVGLRTVLLCERVWVGTTAKAMAAEMKAVDLLFTARGWPLPRQTFASSAWSLTKPDVFDAVAEFARLGVGLTVVPENLDQVTRRIHQWLETKLDGGAQALQVMVLEKGAALGCPKLWKAIPRQQAEDNHPSRMKIRPDSGPVRALGLYLLSEASVSGPGGVRSRELPAWWKHRPVSRKRKA